jgi:gas vesicle protein
MDENEAEEELSPLEEAVEEEVDGEEALDVGGEEDTGERGGLGFLPGLLMGSLAGAALASLLAPIKGWGMRAKAKEEAPVLWGSDQEQEGESPQEAQAVPRRFEGMPGGNVIERVIAIIRSIGERLRDAVEDGKEGAAESEAEARLRYETMTKRRRRKKSA